MPKNTLLDTNTVNTSELLGNGKVYRVPPFQRDYSWTEEHWEDLWNDILAIRKGEERKHYMGTVVLQARTDREYLIIDGQQRLTTMSLIAIAVIKHLDELVDTGRDPEENRERANILRRTYLGDKEPKSLLYSSKLFLNSNNDPFYQGYVLQLREPPNPHRLSATDKLLWQAFQYFYRRIGELAELRESGERLTAFLTDDVGEKLLFIQILVQDELSAYTVFETLNARGVELTATDLLKNYLFSLIPAADLSHVQHQWKRIADLAGTDKLPEFLRHLINSQQSLVRSQRLFRAIKETVASGPAALALLDELEQEADVYSALFDAAHERWREHKEVRRFVRILRLFNVRQLAPLMLAAHRRLELDDFSKVLKLCVAISFRYSVIGRNNPNELERSYNQAAVDIHNRVVASARQIFERLRPIYVTDDAFRRDFMYASIPVARRKKLVRYILCELEMDAGGAAGLDFEDDSATIEHILPENPGPAWLSAFPPDVHGAFLCRLGNYSLLEGTLNRGLENKTLAEKKQVYASSRYRLTRDITGEEWTTERITLRQEHLAARAAHIWRSDFA
jgi:Protein of unknown function DUF262/Protein of unknown function (DUF1524)